MDLINDFEELKPILQEKWLDFYEKNKDLLGQYATDSNNYINSGTILSVLMSLEPKLSDKLRNLLKILEYMKVSKPDANGLLSIIDIPRDFGSLNHKLKEREKAKKELESISPSPLDDFRKTIN